MKVKFRKSFEKDLGKIRDKNVLVKIKAVLESMEKAETLRDTNNIKKLKAEGNYYRIRVGSYRVGFTEDEGIITFIRVLHRKEMYRYFP